MRTIGFIMLATSIAAVGCGQAAGTSGSATTGATAAPTPTSAAFAPDERIAAALPRGGQSTFTVHAFVGATCTLQDSAEPPGAAQHLALYADDDGVVSVTLRHSDPAVQAASLALTCRDDAGHAKTYALDVAVSDDAVERAAAPVSREGKRTLPRLEGDSLELGARELLEKGYPPRPDPAQSPESYARWLKLVQSEPVVIEPRRTVDVGLIFGFESSTDWCGQVIDTAPTTPGFFDVSGMLLLPDSVSYPTSDQSPAAFGLWVGFDGDNMGNGVVQNGAIVNGSVLGGVTAFNAVAFYEWESRANPNGTRGVVVPGFTVHLGDELQVETVVFAASGLAYFAFNDLTQHATMTESLNVPSGVRFSGHEAEWILEWPENGGGNGLLDFGFAGIQHAEAYDNGNNMHTVTTDTWYQDAMVSPRTENTQCNSIPLPASSGPGSVLLQWENWN